MGKKKPKETNGPDLKIIIADDHSILRDGVRLLIETRERWKVVGEANDGLALLETLKKITPDMVIVDLDMPKMLGFEALREIGRLYPQIRTLVLSGFLNDANIKRAITCGAGGLVSKAGLGKELLRAIEVVRKGGTYLSPDIIGTDIDRFCNIKEADDTLSHREIQIVTLIAEGYTSREIGAFLDISPRTVDKHRARILEKLNLQNIVELVRYAFRNGYASLSG